MKKYNWILSVLVLLGICAYMFNYFYQVEKERKITEILGHQKIHARQAVKSFNELFGKWNSVLYYLANDQEIITLNDNGRNRLKDILGILKQDIKGITRTDSSGTIIFTIPNYANSIGANISSQRHMKKILSEHKPVISDVFLAVQGFQAIVIHYPVFKNETFIGTIAFLLNFEQIAKGVLDDIRIGKTGHAWVLSSEGIELYCPVPGHVGKSVYETLQESPNSIVLADSMMAGKEGVLAYSQNLPGENTRQVRKISYYLPLPVNNSFWSLAISCVEDEITASLPEFRNRLIVIFLLIFFGGTAISYFGVKALSIFKESNLRKQAEEDLVKERKLLRTLIDNLPSGIFVKDKNYRKVIVNPIHINSMKGHLLHYGLDPNIDLLGKTDFEILPKVDSDRFMIDDRKVIEEGISILNKVEEGIGPDKSRLWLLISKVPIRDSTGEIIGMVGITTDISDQINTEEALIKAKEKAEESGRLKTAFLNNISHEIRTPLNAIIGFSNLIKEISTENKQLSNYANIIQESSRQLLLIITDIINISTIEAGQVKVTLDEVNINSICSILYEQLKGKAEQKGISFVYKTSLEHTEANIITDQAKFIETLSNLVNNAIKFTDKGYVHYGYELKENTLEFYIEDTGIGIHPEFYNKMFDRFSQAESAYSKKYGGTGLGLSIAKAYVEVLGGKIWFNTIMGEGTTFYFTLPYRHENE